MIARNRSHAFSFNGGERMSEQTTVKDFVKQGLFGRRKIFASVDEITTANVAKVVDDAFITHLLNRGEIEYLWRYYKGDQPNRFRTRELRPELSKRVIENRANEIVSFKVGYLVGKPVQYIASAGNDGVSDAIGQLNDSMRVVGKHSKDKALIEWCMICGIGYRYVTQNNDPRIRSAFNVYTLDPRNTFVIRRNDYTEAVIAGVNYVTDDEGNITFTVYTEDRVYTLMKGSDKPKAISVNAFGAIPIIEYQNNNARQGCFEIVIDLLNAISEFDSMRLEAVEGFVQSLLVLYNCQVDDNVTADTIRQAGMILLKSMNGEKADIKNLSDQLDQSQNQTLKNDMYNSVLQIVGVPSQGDGNTGDSSNNGAIVLKNGWQGAETRAEAFEAMYQQPEMEMLNVVSIICGKIRDGFVFDPADVEVKFTRRNYENILSKSQTLVTMLAQDKIHPKSAYEASGLFIDVEEAYRLGMEWYEKVKAEQAKELQQQTEVKTDVEE